MTDARVLLFASTGSGGIGPVAMGRVTQKLCRSDLVTPANIFDAAAAGAAAAEVPLKFRIAKGHRERAQLRLLLTLCRYRFGSHPAVQFLVV